MKVTKVSFNGECWFAIENYKEEEGTVIELTVSVIAWGDDPFKVFEFVPKEAKVIGQKKVAVSGVEKTAVILSIEQPRVKCAQFVYAVDESFSLPVSDD